VTFIGWVSDYSAIMMAVRNDGNSLSAVAHKLISPRTRRILFVFIFFYLLLIAGAFVGILGAILASRPDVPFGIFVLALMGLFAGYAIYRMRMSIIGVTVLTVAITLAAMALGPLGATFTTGQPTDWTTGPISGTINSLNSSLNTSGALFTVIDPTNADPRVPAIGADGSRPKTATYDPATGAISILPNFLFWSLLLLVFSYLGANLAIWRFAQPVNYIGFWISIIVILVSAVGALIAPFVTLPGAETTAGAFQVADFKGFQPATGGPLQPLWPMLFVTIACGAISGWHALFGSVGTARQLEYETDALPVGGGGMFTENTLALLSLTAVAVAGGAGAGAFAGGVGKLIHVASFQTIPLSFGTALGFGTFVVIVLTVVQLVFRVMRVTLGEWLGDAWVGFKNQHIASIIGMVVTMALVLSGTWVYLWQLFGASNQLMAALSLLLVTVWLRSIGKNPAFAGIPMVFMYVTTMAATAVTAYNLFVTIATKEGQAAISVVGAWAMIAVAVLLLGAAALIAWDAWHAWNRYRDAPTPEPAPQPTA
jgi:carbon starvation protein